ncbi:MAG: acetyl-CoA hydrolase/transferase family protein [Chitinophagaceae bacterium]|nr:acetyl-CoA hydrolase/transferase family protein [Chitinophagaceae bacterium]MBL0307216.1 acetyl-CoA hydrolase/transferase family protein [Chitinophagaceae bacterium]MBP8244817.1 acetyl-CoA hydrolase/transferase family protein [Chitinophagaceae bacterium]HQV59806.1 acetyl-CoA hydrolase/transferase C-terminal domain-containing protein [Chitinophagaceae bacterium]HQV85911.1 acetyl-CoA hydrolase/transferase C-terminal domain-containing protein [Chitinophagaceae bacterium]
MKLPVEYMTAGEALAVIKSGQRVFIQGSAQTPLYLLRELAKRAPDLRDVELTFITVHGDIELDKPQYADAFKINCMFVSESVRNAVNEGRADFVPVFLSDIPDLFRKQMQIDVALVQVSPPDQHGYCSLGVSVDVARSAVNTATHIIAQVNPKVPRTHGDSLVHTKRFTAMVYHEEDLPEVDYGTKVREDELKIGQLIAGLIEDGSTLQMGIGTIPDAVLRSLHSHKNLGVHTEMCSDGIIDLFDNDVINNSKKRIHPNKTVTGFAVGTRRLYDYVDDNPAFVFLDIDYVNDPHVIRRNPKVVAINSAIEVDITGQVCADSIGTKQYSGIGGQMDFMRGAALSEGGKPIIALTSRTTKGVSRIVPFLKPGAGVVTTRGHIHYVVTEFGVAYLFGMNLRQRAKALIEIAHPDDREILEKACFERFKVF